MELHLRLEDESETVGYPEFVHEHVMRRLAVPAPDRGVAIQACRRESASRWP